MSKIRGNVQTLVASATQSASGNSGPINIVQLGGQGPDSAVFILWLTASSTPTTLDVYLQSSTDGGTTWWDFAHFGQLGAVSTGKQVITWSRKAGGAVTANLNQIAGGDGVIAAGVVINGPIVDNYFRVKWVIAGTSYTFSVLAILDVD